MFKWHGADLAGLRFNEDLSTRPPWLPPDSGECRLAIPLWWEEAASVPTAGVARSALCFFGLECLAVLWEASIPLVSEPVPNTVPTCLFDRVRLFCVWL